MKALAREPLYVRNKFDPLDGLKGGIWEGTKGSKSEDKKADSGTRIQEHGANEKKIIETSKIKRGSVIALECNKFTK